MKINFFMGEKKEGLINNVAAMNGIMQRFKGEWKKGQKVNQQQKATIT